MPCLYLVSHQERTSVSQGYKIGFGTILTLLFYIFFTYISSLQHQCGDYIAWYCFSQMPECSLDTYRLFQSQIFPLTLNRVIRQNQRHYVFLSFTVKQFNKVFWKCLEYKLCQRIQVKTSIKQEKGFIRN